MDNPLVVQATRVGLSNLQTLRLNSFCASSTMGWRVPQTLLEHSVDNRFFFFSLSLHLGFFISSFKNLDQPLQFIFHSYLVHVILITVFLFWIVHDITIFFFNFTLHHFLNYKQFITLQMFFQFHSLWFLLFQIQLSFSWLLFFHLGPFLF